MNPSSSYHAVPCLMTGLALVLSNVLLSGCTLPIRPDSLFGSDLRQFPAVVLSAQNGGHDYVFDWRKNTIGGTELIKWKPNARYWRLHLFRFSDGQRIGNNKGDWKDFQKGEYEESFSGLDFDTLMRVDLDLDDDLNGSEDARSVSFIVLLHDE